MSIEPPDLWFQVQHSPLYTNLAFACKTETLGSLYSHALLILTKSFKSKHQVVYEQKFIDLISSTCQVSVERSMLGSEFHASFFHNSRLIRRIQQKEILKKFRDLSRNRTQIACLAVGHLNHYTKLFSVLVWHCNSILFMHEWFCPIHLIGWKSLHFEKTRRVQHSLGNILLLEFFVYHIVKPLMPILALLPISFNYEKPRLSSVNLTKIQRIW